MRRREWRGICAAAALAVAAGVCLQGSLAAAQGRGRGAASANLPKTWTRTSDGQPDVQGDWNAEVSGTFSLTSPRAGLNGDQLEQFQKGRPLEERASRIIDPPDGQIPYQPWAAARQKYIEDNQDNPTKPEHVDSQARCLPGGVPREMFHTGSKFLQFPGYFVVLSNQNHIFRRIPLDGSPHLGPAVKLWMGDSRGRWEGNTLVVDTTNLNGKPRFTMIGDFGTDALHVTEQFEFADPNAMTYRATFDDPKAYTRPWTIAAQFKRSRAGAGEESWENACHEGERSADNMVIGAGPEAKP